MKTKTLLILIGILVLLTGLGLTVRQMLQTQSEKTALGSLLLKEFPANRICSVMIRAPEAQVLLNKQEDRWGVENYHRFPVDFEKLTQMIRRLKEAKIGGDFKATPEVLNRLALRDPEDAQAAKEQKALSLELKDEKGVLLAKILVGKNKSDIGEGASGQGQYVALNQNPTVYLIDKDLTYVERNPLAWLDKGLIQADPDEIKTIRCLDLDGKKQFYAFERPQKGKDLALTGLNPGPRIKSSALNGLANIVYGLTLDDVVDPANPPKTTFSKRFDFELFNGLIYSLYPGDACEKDRCLLIVKVDYREIPAKEEKKEDQKAEPDKAKDKPAPQTAPVAKSPDEMRTEAAALHKKLSAWIYVIPQVKHEALVTDLKGLLELVQAGTAKAGKVVPPKKAK